MKKSNQLRPNLRPNPRTRNQTLIHNVTHDPRDIFEAEAICIFVMTLNRIHRDGATVGVVGIHVDPRPGEFHLVEAGWVVAPFVEEGVFSSFIPDVGHEREAAAACGEGMHWIFACWDGGAEVQ